MSSDVNFYFFSLTHTSDFCENIKYGKNSELKRIEERRKESVLNAGGQQADRFLSEVGLFR
jgi:hypothetical protein